MEIFNFLIALYLQKTTLYYSAFSGLYSRYSIQHQYSIMFFFLLSESFTRWRNVICTYLYAVNSSDNEDVLQRQTCVCICMCV